MSCCAPAAVTELQPQWSTEAHHPWPGQRRTCLSWVLNGSILKPFLQLAQLSASVCCLYLSVWLPAGCVPWKHSLFHVCAHILHTLVLNLVPFHAPLVPLFPCLPFRSPIELAVLKARLLISRKPLQGQCSHCFFVNCPQK